MLPSSVVVTIKSALCVEWHRGAYNIAVRGLHQSYARYLDQRWRAKRGLTANPNKFSPLTNLPDYSFKDGRPTPLGIRQKARVDKQRAYAERIIELVEQVDYAVERHAKMQEEERQKRQQILDNKLKPKGNLLLQKHTLTNDIKE